jgi:hypothetical protein
VFFSCFHKERFTRLKFRNAVSKLNGKTSFQNYEQLVRVWMTVPWKFAVDNSDPKTILTIYAR